MSKRNFKRSVDRKQSKQIKENSKALAVLKKQDEHQWLDTASYGDILDVGTSFVVNIVKPMKLDGTIVANNAALNQRKGKEIYMQGLHIVGQIYLDPGATSSVPWAKVRMLVVQFPCAVANQQLDNMLLETTAGLGGGQFIYALKNRMPRTPYKILYDRTINLSNFFQSTSESHPVEDFRKNININIKLKGRNQRATWAETEATSGPSTGGIAVYLMGDQGAAAFPEYRLNCRLRYSE